MSGASLEHSRVRRALAGLVAALALVLGSVQLMPAEPAAAVSNPCGPPVVSVIACENTQTGDPTSDWQISGSGSTTIQGYATSISVSPGDTVQFKINTPSTNYHFDVLRLGYYQGNGARKVAAGLKPSVPLPQTQPACLNDTTPTGLIDCGNWAVSASWTVPTNAVSGVYIAHLVRDDTTGASSHIVFIVRNDASHSDILFQTDDETWQAYNTYGGNSLYSCTVNCPTGNPLAYKGAFKVSYNRPFHSADDDTGHSWVMYAEYPMIRFMEANGYDVTYTTGMDVGTSAGGSLLKNHKTFMTAGHDEYWSGTQRSNVEAARDAGVNLAFFTGNETYWKTRTEPSIDGTSTANRTLVCYKETHYDGVVDPADPPTWTGSWQDPRFSPPGDGGRPQNALTGQLFVVNSGTTDITVPAQYSKLRFWRNTSVASLTGSQVATLGAGDGTLGYEWDVEPDNGFRPTGEFDLSSTTSTSAEVFTDYGSTTQTGGTATHHLSLYRAASGALVFGAGTVQWVFGLDSAGGTPDPAMQQATVNLFADMGVQPYAPIAGVTRATASTDTTAPTSTVTSPASGANLGDGTKVTVSGTATDTGGGVVAGVEVSTDGGTTWHPATGTSSWTYSWIVHGSPTTTIKTRAVDDSGNVESPSAGVVVNVGCTCSIWGTASAPTKSDSGTATAVEVGVKFKSDVSGKVTGVRFYKASTNTGTHVGNLWTASGTKLASATFTGESSSGWQQVSFASPVAINAGTPYVVSYFAPSGHTAQDDSYFYSNPSPLPQTYSTVDSPPLHALRNVNGTVNGVFQNSSTSTFPSGSANARNYWVDVMFTQNTGPATVPGAASAVTATPGHSSAVVTWTAPSDGGSLITSYTVTPYAGSTALAPTTVTGNPPSTSATVVGLTNGTAYTFTVATTNAVGTGAASPPSNATTPSSASCSACTIWPLSAKPTTTDEGDTKSTELGVKFKADLNGVITGIRFYKSTANTGTHIGNLWAADGTRLASGTFTNESASGWQKLTFASPVAVTAGSVYVASYYAPNGHYSGDGTYFASAGVDNPPLHALKDGVSGGDGVYSYSGSSVFPVSTYNSENYWVDVNFATWPATVPDAPTGASAASGDHSATVSWTAPADGGSPLTGYTVTPYIGTTAQTPTTVTGSPPATTATVTGLTNGTAYTFSVAATNAVGSGPSSAATSAVTPAVATVPGAPGNVSATAGNGSVQVSWSAAANNGSPVTSYTVTPYLGSTAQAPTTVSGSPPATSASMTGLTNGSTYTFTVSATNAVGSGPASAASNPVVPSTAGCTSVCSIWSASTTPPTPDEADPQATEVGVKFKSDANGSITGMRFYKSVANTGTHIGNLWTSTGTKLATGTFTNESASGWQQLTFATPVAITAGTVYVASYFAPVGHYAGDGAYFATAGVDNVPLHALKNGVSGGNGVYLYTSTSAFPTSTYNSENYWVDVSFVDAATPPAAPSNVSATAGSGSAAVSWTAPYTGGSPITSYTVTPHAGSTTLAPTTVSGNPPATSAAVTGLTNGTAYTFTVSATNGVGTGPDSPASNAVTPVTVSPPGAPSAVTATAGNGSAVVSWTAPSSGGNGITSYTVTPYVGTTAQSPTTVSGSPPSTTTTVTGLTNGTTYTFTVSATNSVGTGSESAPSSPVTPASAPAAPTGVTATASAGSAVVSWTAPSSGGRPITSYTVTPYAGSTALAPTTVSGSPPATSTTVSGLTNGTAYTFTVSATNGIGTGPQSAASPAVTPATTPAAPTGVSATAGDSSATVSWTAPSNGGSAITGYTVTPYAGSTALAPTTVSGNPPATSVTVTGLTNGTAYTFTVSATNAAGTGPASAASPAVTPAALTAPAAPTAVTATAGSGSAVVSWTAPSNGGSPITLYTVTPYIGTTAQAPTTVTGNPPATSTSVTGLTNGTAYTFTVSATNSAGTSAESAHSNAITPATLSAPGAPTAVSATPGNASAVVSWTAPSNGGSAITSYAVTPHAGSTTLTPTTVSGSPPSTSVTVTGLTNGTAYTFTVSATNSVGTSPDSAPSSAVTPAATPGAPTNVTATAGPASAVVTWTAPSDGGSPLTSYTVTPFIGATAQTPTTVSGAPPATTVTVSGLTNGTAYTFTVSATNSAGTGPASAPSAATTPTATSCAACTIWAPTATPVTPDVSDSSAVELGVKFKADVDGTITGIRFYKGTGNTGTHTGTLWAADGTKLASATFTNESAKGWQQVSFATPVAITAGTVYVASYFAPVGNYAADGAYFASAGVDNGTLHALANGVSGGDGVYQYGSTTAFPGNSYNATNYWVDVVFASGQQNAPAAPTGVTATAGNASATVSWTAPASGGSPITSYTVTPHAGSTALAPTTVSGNPPATTANVTGLTNGTAYTFTVSATNAVGTGPDSAASNAVTPAATTVPGAPTGVSATAGNASAVVSWTAPSNGGSPITGYTVTPYAGSTALSSTTVSGSPPATSATVSGLTNGTAYTFTVSATNAVGTGPASAPSTAVTPAASSCAACTIWSPTVTPTTTTTSDASSVELGVKFKADVNGSITGIRFYKGAGNTGTHIGTLWSASGTKLASATFTNESASGWQQVSFATPVAVTAGTVYVASYFAPAGHYAADGAYFSTAGVDNGPLHALQDGVSGGNGVYLYGSTSAFPTSTWNATNYWVDVVFATS